MNPERRGSLFVALILIAVGVVLILANFLPGFRIVFNWPFVFYVLALFFYVPVGIFPGARKGLAALFIPGTIMLGLGLIFTYNVYTNDWVSWAYSWMLIPGSVGIGLALASWLGSWESGSRTVGIWMAVISLALFGFFAAMFGEPILKIAGAAFLILAGLVFLIHSFIRPNRGI
jgi:hypothetical protein